MVAEYRDRPSGDGSPACRADREAEHNASGFFRRRGRIWVAGLASSLLFLGAVGVVLWLGGASRRSPGNASTDTERPALAPLLRALRESVTAGDWKASNALEGTLAA